MLPGGSSLNAGHGYSRGGLVWGILLPVGSPLGEAFSRGVSSWGRCGPIPPHPQMEMDTVVEGTHPTEMHSCSILI